MQNPWRARYNPVMTDDDREACVGMLETELAVAAQKIGLLEMYGFDTSLERESVDELQRELFALEEGLPFTEYGTTAPFDEITETKYWLRYGH